mgnify:CR=1 FL=1
MEGADLTLSFSRALKHRDRHLGVLTLQGLNAELDLLLHDAITAAVHI